MDYRKLGNSGTLVSNLQLAVSTARERGSGKVAATLGIAPATIALSWVINRPGVTSAIVGARTQRQLLDNLAAADLHLDDDSTTVLETASDPDPAPYPYDPFGTAQRTPTANAPEALGRLISAHAATTGN